MTRRALVTTLTLLAACNSVDPPAAYAALEPPPKSAALTLSTERVVIFKDGYALVVKHATGVADAYGRVYTNDVPEGVILGSFWAMADKGVVKSMRAEWVESRKVREQTGTALSVLDLLRGNPGAEVTLTLNGGETIAGKLIAVLDEPGDSPEPSPGLDHQAKETITRLEPRGGQIVVVAKGSSKIAVPVGEVRRVEGPALQTTLSRRELVERSEKRLTFELGEAAAERRVGLRILYFREGLRWIPTYRLGGELDDDGELALQGEVLNEAEDLLGAEMDLVVGAPHFRFKDVPSPLVLESTMTRALASVAPTLMSQQISNADFRSRAGERFTALAPDPYANTAVTTTAEQDLFSYSVGPTFLAKGARIAIELWRRKVPIRHLYTADLALVRGRTVEQAIATGSPLVASAGKVWHQLEFENRGNTPFTTGPALILKGNLPLGQDLLTYTSIGGRALLPVTVAVDVLLATKEKEIARKVSAIRVDGYDYAEVKTHHDIELQNNRKDRITVRVTAAVPGKVDHVPEGGRITVTDFRAEDWPNGGAHINNHSDVWIEVELAPGQRRTIGFDSTYYLR